MFKIWLNSYNYQGFAFLLFIKNGTYCRYPYVAVVVNFSQMWALYCLVQFYKVTHEKLRAIKPLGKFISFKAIVFATWWQGLGIAFLCYIEVLPKEGNFQTGLQDFLICIEVSSHFLSLTLELL